MAYSVAQSGVWFEVVVVVVVVVFMVVASLVSLTSSTVRIDADGVLEGI